MLGLPVVYPGPPVPCAKVPLAKWDRWLEQEWNDNTVCGPCSVRSLTIINNFRIWVLGPRPRTLDKIFVLNNNNLVK